MQANSEAVILWYDSVTLEGKLDWQNELNSSNEDFFDACDGIFLNYTRTPGEQPKYTYIIWIVCSYSMHILRTFFTENLEASKSLALSKNRLKDVFVGVDVFGRGCFGGGGFNTNKAMEVIRQQNMSAALFAPSWTWEIAERAELAAEADAGQMELDFAQREHAFWNLLEPFLFFRGPKVSMLEQLERGRGNN